MTPADDLPDGSVARILARIPAGGGPHIVGIDGPAGSGKSTLAADLAAVTGAPVVGIDDFVGWHDLDPGADTWWPRLEAEVLAPFLAARDSAYRRRDWFGDPDGLGLLPDAQPLPAGALLVLEGVSVTRRRVADRLALRVWVEAPQEERLRRGLERDGTAELDHWRGWQAMETAFFLADGTRERADLVIATG